MHLHFRHYVFDLFEIFPPVVLATHRTTDWQTSSDLQIFAAHCYSNDDPHLYRQAETGIALAMITLQYFGCLLWPSHFLTDKRQIVGMSRTGLPTDIQTLVIFVLGLSEIYL